RRILSAERSAGWVWDSGNGRLVSHLPHKKAVDFAEFSRSGLEVITFSSDKTARIWDRETGRELTAPLRHDDTVYSADFSPDGKRIVTGSGDKAARIWDTGTGQMLTKPLLHADALY